MKIPFALIALFGALSLHASEIPAEVLLWPDGAPGSGAFADKPEVVDSKSGGNNISSVHRPTITPYLPDPAKATGTAVLIAPGGGHRVLCLGHEGYALAQWFADHGIAAFVLKYRLSKEEGSTYTIEDHAMADTRRALRLIRLRAAEWGVRPDRVGILGFSAGGELAAYAAMKSDPGEKGRHGPDRTRKLPSRFSGAHLPRQVGNLYRRTRHAACLHRLRF